MKTINQRLQNSGGILLIAILFIGALASLSIAVMTVVRNKSRQAYQTSGWQEALSAAESGVDVAVGELKRMIDDPAAAFTEANGWEHSSNTTYSPENFWEPSPYAAGYAEAPSEDKQWVKSTGLPSDGAGGYAFNSTAGRYRKVITGNILQKEGGLGGQSASTVVIIDTTENLKDDSDEYWYRIRSVGIAQVPGGTITVGEGRSDDNKDGKADGRSMDNELRRLDLRMNHRTGEVVSFPQASRIVEAIAKPISAFAKALHSRDGINMNNHNIIVDSYDSRDPLKSDNGQWPGDTFPDRVQENGDIATNGDLIDAGGAHIYGDAATNGGTVLGAGNVTGEISNDFYEEVYQVSAPTQTATTGTPSGTINSNTTLTATAAGTNVNITGINLSGSKAITINGAGDGSPTYISIVVNGDIGMSGNGEIRLGPGVYVRLFVSGNVDITGNGFSNPGTPRQLQMYGTAPMKNGDGSPASAKTMKIAGNGAFHGSCYAPNYDLELKGGGSSDDSVCGAFVCKSVYMNGVTSVHYDEALTSSGLVTSYKLATWFEDIR